MQTIQGHLYDFPQYYDLVYGSDWKAEFDFLRECFFKHVSRKVRSVFEPACGTGRLMFRLAKAGYTVSGVDLNERAVKYCNDRLERHGFSRSAFVGDMSQFELPRRVDAAFNTVSSFRHLSSEQAALDHLSCVAGALRSGGIYVLGLHLTPTTEAPSDEEQWSAQRGNLCVTTRLWQVERDLEQRRERYAMEYDVHTPTRRLRIEDTFEFRTYTREQMMDLVGKIKGLDLVETYDFSYDIRRPIELGSGSEDVVLVLSKS